MNLELINGLRVTAEGTVPNRRVRVDSDGSIGALDGQAGGGPGLVEVSLPPTALVLPGLINAHDHLIGTFQPRVGFGPYLNWLQWDNDLKRSAVFRPMPGIEVNVAVEPCTIARLSASVPRPERIVIASFGPIPETPINN